MSPEFGRRMETHRLLRDLTHAFNYQRATQAAAGPAVSAFPALPFRAKRGPPWPHGFALQAERRGLPATLEGTRA